MQKLVTGLLKSIVHPEASENIVDGGFVESVVASEEKITVSLLFKKARDPFALKIKGQVQTLLEGRFPQLKGEITVFIKEGAPAKPKVEKRTTTGSIRNIVAIASGKGGVG
ncbi:MAG: DUF59 domain-containing protein, partial [Alistipes sp.]|nr:DUF59 domain-containing protein [Alistipes sp.]